MSNEKLEKMRARISRRTHNEQKSELASHSSQIEVEQKSGGTYNYNKSIRWFDTIRKDTSKVPEAYEYFKGVVADAEPHTKPIGRLIDITEEVVGLTAFYSGHLKDTQAIRRWLEERQTIVENQTYNWLMHDEEAQALHGTLKTTEAGKMAKVDSKVIELGDYVRLMAYVEHMIEMVYESLMNRQYVIANIINIRKEGFEEVFVNPYRETTNE